MSLGFSKTILLGNLTRDPDLRKTASGLAVAKFGLAINRSYTTKDGERRDEVTFVDIDAFGKQAEVIAKYLSKGSPLMVEGRLKLDQWEDDSGQKRSKLGVVLETFQFVGGGNREGPSEPSSAPRGSAAPSGSKDDDAFEEEDVPF